MAERHVAAQDIGRHHPGEVDRVLGAAERRRVAKLGLFQVVNGAAHLDRHGEGIDPLGNTVLAQHLRAEQAPIGFAEDDFHRQVFGARVIPGV